MFSIEDTVHFNFGGMFDPIFYLPLSYFVSCSAYETFVLVCFIYSLFGVFVCFNEIIVVCVYVLVLASRIECLICMLVVQLCEWKLS